MTFLLDDFGAFLLCGQALANQGPAKDMAPLPRLPVTALDAPAALGAKAQAKQLSPKRIERCRTAARASFPSDLLGLPCELLRRLAEGSPRP
jgi:hypothetical protein